MARPRSRRNCRDCGGEFWRDELNKSGRCFECAKVALAANMDQMRQRSGPAWERWRAAMSRLVL